MRRLLSRWFLMAAALLLLVYAADRVSLVYRIPPGRQQYGSVEVRTLSAVRLKNNRVQYLTDPPEARQCAHSLFPQLGLPPCWYLERHSWQRVDY